FQTEMEPKLADEEYRKALASDSRNARVLNNYGGFLYEQKRYEEAYQRLLEASQDTLYPERSRVFENLGLVSLQMKKPAQAKEYFEKSLRLNRNQPSVALEMADLLYKEREYVPARQYYDLFAQGGGQNARSLLLGIRLAKVFEDRDTAASYGLQLKRLYPGSPEYQEFQAEK
ncbi:type 4a pilus biogenesis protein PilF, partial [Pseudomonas aeruginosa]